MDKRESKKDHILCNGIDVMLAHGYNGTSVKDIVDASGVPKGSFYNYFDSKESFAVEALSKVGNDSLDFIRGHFSKQNISTHEKFASFFNALQNFACDQGYSGGCFLGNMSQEMADNSEQIRHKLKFVVSQKVRIFQDALDQAKENGEILESIDTSAMAEFIYNAWQGTINRMKTEKSCEPYTAFMAILPTLFISSSKHS